MTRLFPKSAPCAAQHVDPLRQHERPMQRLQQLSQRKRKRRKPRHPKDAMYADQNELCPVTRAPASHLERLPSLLRLLPSLRAVRANLPNRFPRQQCLVLSQIDKRIHRNLFPRTRCCSPNRLNLEKTVSRPHRDRMELVRVSHLLLLELVQRDQFPARHWMTRKTVNKRERKENERRPRGMRESPFRRTCKPHLGREEVQGLVREQARLSRVRREVQRPV
jgi:hypothetical protein